MWLHVILLKDIVYPVIGIILCELLDVFDVNNLSRKPQLGYPHISHQETGWITACRLPGRVRSTLEVQAPLLALRSIHGSGAAIVVGMNLIHSPECWVAACDVDVPHV